MNSVISKIAAFFKREWFLFIMLLTLAAIVALFEVL